MSSVRGLPPDLTSGINGWILCHWLSLGGPGCGSLIERLLPESIHTVITKGFALKVILFVLASNINCLGTP